MQLPVHKIMELEPPARNKGRGGRKSLADLVRTAVLLGAEALPHLRHTGRMGG